MQAAQYRDIVDLWIGRLTERSELSGADRDVLRALPFHVVEYAAKREVVGIGETTTECCIVARGLVSRVGTVAGGGKQITAFYIPGDMPDLHSLAVPKATTGLETITPSTVLKVSHAVVRRVVERSPNLGIAFWRECSIDALTGAEWILNLGQRQALARIAHLFCEMAARIAGPITTDSFSFILPLTQLHIADAAGTSAVHVNRTIQELRRLGLLGFEQFEVQINDWPALCKVAEFDESYLHLARR